MGEVRLCGAVRNLIPVRDLGIGLAFIGGLVLVMRLMWSMMCNGGFIGPCIDQPYPGRQGYLELVGGGLLVVGLVLVLVGSRTAAPSRRAPRGSVGRLPP
jgi:hypothetical protein